MQWDLSARENTFKTYLINDDKSFFFQQFKAKLKQYNIRP